MKTVQHVLHAKSGPVHLIPHDATVYDALALMSRFDIGALVVIDSGEIAGMFSERDYARKVILHGKSSRDLIVAEVMTRQVFTVTPHCTVDDCMAIMTDHRVRHLPVLDGDGVSGIVSIGDVVKALLDEQRFTIAQLEHYITT
ncbi:MAG: CBS domain-containing protein [Acidobacteriota bacterium]